MKVDDAATASATTSSSKDAQAVGELASVDGVIGPAGQATIPATDEGFLRGDGAFEVIRVYAGIGFALGDHLDRMERSAASLQLEWPAPRSRIEEEIASLLAARGGVSFEGCLRLVLTRGRRRLMFTEPLPPHADRVRLGFVTFAPTRVLDGVKSLSYAANMLSSRLAKQRGFDEALLVTPHGRVLEAPTSSLFWADADGRLFTPPLDDHILASITRERLMGLVTVEERPTTQDDVLGASEAFLASTTREAHPVAAIEGREFAAVGPRTREAAEAFRAHVREAVAGPPS